MLFLDVAVICSVVDNFGAFNGRTRMCNKSTRAQLRFGLQSNERMLLVNSFVL